MTLDMATRLQQSPIFPKTAAAVLEFEQFFRLSTIPFFREYTDHSFKHSIEVLQTAIEILSPESHSVVSSEDLNILVLATQAHDSGLHVSEDVFLKLIAPTNRKIGIQEIDEKNWPELWAEYLSEAKKFNAKKLISLFGDSEAVREPPSSALDMTQRDRLLIGEFLRRHHPRFAHEFCLGLIPNAEHDHFDLLHDLDYTTKDITGLIARSHGMSLRSTFPYIESKYDLRDFNRTHIIFIMTLLRIADYLQIQPGRAPKFFSHLHRIASPYSTGEWRVHQSIDNITTSSFDPEAIHVAATPKSVHDYLRIKRWIEGLQNELDRCWAVLGETYGRFGKEGLDRLKINVRRVRSNFEQKSNLQKRIKFVPEALRFTASEPELLNLLMGPLYGEDPLYGVRELTQNAADSVREMEHLKAQGIATSNDQLELQQDIEIETAAEPDWSFTIRDRGTGMTLDVIRNYFLRAGASFRNSDLWRKNFQDEQGQSKIARTGRFGVGALSAFLIGGRITVYTRHYSDETGTGFEFSCNIDDDEIQVLKKPGRIGTTIHITSNEKQIKAIQSYFEKSQNGAFYYKAESPKIAFIPSTDSKEKKDKKVRSHWIETKLGKYEKVEWERLNRGGELYCNGILIGDIHKPSEHLIFQNSNDFWVARNPTISIIDNNGNLPVDLARKGLVRKDDELADSIRQSIAEEFIASIYSIDGDSPSEIGVSLEKANFMYDVHGWKRLMWGSQGFLILDKGLIEHCSPDHLLVTDAKVENIDVLTQDSFLNRSLIVNRSRRGFDSKTHLLQMVSDTGYATNYPNFSSRYSFGHDQKSFNKNYLFMTKDSYESIFELKSVPKYVHEMRKRSMTLEIGDQEWVLVDRTGFTSDDNLVPIRSFFERTAKKEETRQGPTILWTRFFCKEKVETRFSKIWQQSFTTLMLPYNRRARLSAIKTDAPIKRYL